MELLYKKATHLEIDGIVALKMKQCLYVANREGKEIDNENQLRKNIKSILVQQLNKTIFFFVVIDKTTHQLIACNGLVVYQKVPSNHNYLGKSAYLTSVYTELEYRRKGIQNILMRNILNFLDKNQISQVELDAVNPHAISLYEKFGFMKEDSKYQKSNHSLGV